MTKLLTLEESVKLQQSADSLCKTKTIFGVSTNPDECKIILIPVPWDKTSSYHQSSAQAPNAIAQASAQLDLEDNFFKNPYYSGIALVNEPNCLVNFDNEKQLNTENINLLSTKINIELQEIADYWTKKDKICAVIGGDHSAPLGLLRNLNSTNKGGFGVLHFDAHFDLRKSYSGYKYSHASIMYNALHECKNIKKIVHVGIRDYSKQERILAESHKKLRPYYASNLFYCKQVLKKSWDEITHDLIAQLPHKVYISFDIDVLEQNFCPNTGTPVPGGLTFDEAIYMIEQLAATKRKIIGFDLCEVGIDPTGREWDANVAARILYKLCGAAS